MKSQPLICVDDVEASSLWYQQVLNEICQKVVDEESQAGIMGLNNTHHDTHAQLTHTIQR